VDVIELWVRLAGAVAALITLASILIGLWRGTRRPKGRMIGKAQLMFRWPVYILISILYFGTCYLLWQPLPLMFSLQFRAVALMVGTLLYFPGMALILWGRMTLGTMYDVSSSVGAQLYSDHRLVTEGPYAYVRHPMYLGILIIGLGGLLIYRTWTLAFVALTFLGLIFRARNEEQGLADEFGEQWEEYCRQVPPWLPRQWRRSR
jgi:protein-S-isoprenylcysteine O-methyltransferase Ste14